MNSRLKNELAVITGIAALLLYRRGANPRLSVGLGALALGFQFFPQPKRFSYTGKHVVITGGSRGLGLALAEQLMSEGANVSILARDHRELSDAIEQLESIPSGKAAAYDCDVIFPHELMLALNSAHGHFGPIDMVINNAGAMTVGPFETMERADFDAQMHVHFHAVMEGMTRMVPYFQKMGGGRIVNISSIGAKIAVPHMSAYCASKFALSGLSRSLATELDQFGIKVTTVYPGLMRTGSSIQAVFKGDQKREFAWFAALDLIPGFSMSPHRAARRIIDAARSGQTELILSVPGKVGALLNALFPEITASLIKFVAHQLPHGLSLERKTGAQVYGWFRKHLWAKPLARMERQSAERLNQRMKDDPEFNLGV